MALCLDASRRAADDGKRQQKSTNTDIMKRVRIVSFILRAAWNPKQHLAPYTMLALCRYAKPWTEFVTSNQETQMKSIHVIHTTRRKSSQNLMHEVLMMFLSAMYVSTLAVNVSSWLHGNMTTSAQPFTSVKHIPIMGTFSMSGLASVNGCLE